MSIKNFQAPDKNNDDTVVDGGKEIIEITSEGYQADPIKKQKAATARTLAYLLVGILAVSVAAHYGIVAWMVYHGKTDVVATLATIFDTWLPVISGLSGSAVTYFFTREK